MTSAFWWLGRPNFGDWLNPLLLKRFADIDVEWKPAADADILCVGSVMESVKADWAGYVAGIGKLHEGTDAHAHLRGAKVLGLRGPLTAQGVKGNYVVADPGLLADELVQPNKEFNLGIIPHWSDKRTWSKFEQYSPLIIKATDDPLEVVRQIGSCRKIITSSLHGLIVADAFAIPRRIEYSETLDREGGLFKFQDYMASINMKLELGVTQQAPRYRIEDMQAELFDMLEYLGKLVKHEAA